MKFIVKTHEYSKALTSAKSDDFYNFIDNSLDIISTLRNVLEVIEEATNNELDQWSEIDAYEESTIEDYSSILVIKQGRFSRYASINHCYGTLINQIDAYNQKMSNFLSLGLYANDTWRENMAKRCKDIISILMYTIWYDYDVEKTAQDCCYSEDVEIDMALSSYCDAKDIDKYKFIEDLVKYRTEYKYSFSIFEDYPEFEEPFICIMGPYLGGVDDTRLTIQQVRDVCDGRLTPEELIEEFMDSLEEMDQF